MCFKVYSYIKNLNFILFIVLYRSKQTSTYILMRNIYFIVDTVSKLFENTKLFFIELDMNINFKLCQIEQYLNKVQ